MSHTPGNDEPIPFKTAIGPGCDTQGRRTRFCNTRFLADHQLHFVSLRFFQFRGILVDIFLLILKIIVVWVGADLCALLGLDELDIGEGSAAAPTPPAAGSIPGRHRCWTPSPAPVQAPVPPPALSRHTRSYSTAQTGQAVFTAPAWHFLRTGGRPPGSPGLRHPPSGPGGRLRPPGSGSGRSAPPRRPGR